MFRRPSALVAAALLTLGVAACASDDDSADGQGGADRAVSLVAAFYPLQFVAERVGGAHAGVTGLAPPGVEAHDLELSPRQVAAVSEADLVIYLAEFQPAVDDAVAAHARAALDVATVVPLLEGTPHEHGHGDEHADEGDEHAEEGDDHAEEGDEHAEEAEHAEEGEAHGEADPHLWLDPTRLATVGDEVATRLAELDPDRADDYRANAAALRQELETLDTEYTDALATCERREIVVSHAAFGYLADRYDLEQIAISGLSPEDEPTPQRLAEVVHEAREHGATTIFFEVLVSDRVARVIAEDVGATTAVLDPIEGLAPGSTEDYLSLMRNNLAALREALGCS